MTSDKNIKIELTTNIEWIIRFLSIGSLIGFVASLVNCMQPGHTPLDLIGLFACFIGIIIFGVLWLKYEEFYIINFEKEALVRRRIVFSSQKDTVIEKIDHIDAVIANASFYYDKHRQIHWSYTTEIVNFIGKVYRIGDGTDFMNANLLAKKFSRITGVTYVMGDPSLPFKPSKIGDKYTFKPDHSIWK